MYPLGEEGHVLVGSKLLLRFSLISHQENQPLSDKTVTVTFGNVSSTSCMHLSVFAVISQTCRWCPPWSLLSQPFCVGVFADRLRSEGPWPNKLLTSLGKPQHLSELTVPKELRRAKRLEKANCYTIMFVLRPPSFYLRLDARRMTAAQGGSRQ